MSELLEEFLAGDRHRALSAIWKVIKTRDPEVIRPLVPQLGAIEESVDKLELGGALHSNTVTYGYALEKIERFARGDCWCGEYPGLPFYEPNKERDAGRVLIISHSEPDLNMTYVCECTICGQRFDVEQGCHHFEWWNWVAVEPDAQDD